jgi:hypothetical protein
MAAVYHVTVECTAEEDDAFSVEAVAAELHRFAPRTIAVDTAGIGKVVLASLRARGLPATALEKRPRPTLPEVQRVEELSKQVDKLEREAELRERDLTHLREYQRDIRVLISRLDLCRD